MATKATPKEGRKLKPYHVAMIVGGLFTAIMTLIFDFTDLDLTISGAFYNPAGPPYFPIGDTEPWITFYDMDKPLLYTLIG
nr:hypothetical protein [Candidatus Sigynarchaeota archaeon]